MTSTDSASVVDNSAPVVTFPSNPGLNPGDDPSDIRIDDPGRSIMRHRMSKADFKATRKNTYSYGFQNRLDQKIDRGVELIGVSELKQLHFYRQLMAEFFGTFLLVALGCSCLNDIRAPPHPAALTMSSIIIAWGFVIATVIWTLAHVSGCFLNPAVTIAMFVNRRVPLLRCIAYILVQIPGAIAGSAFHTYLRGNKLNVTCQTLLNRPFGVDEVKGFIVEFFLTFVLLFFVFATIDDKRLDHGGSHAFMVGGVVMVLVNVGAEFTGAGMNPARSLGPAVIHGNWDAHWVYWAAPILGGTLGGLFYDVLLSERVVAWSRFLQVGPDLEVNQ